GVVARICIHDPDVALFLLCFLLFGILLRAGECDPLAVRGDSVGTENALPIGNHFSLAAVNRDSINIALPGAFRSEEHRFSIGCESRILRAFLTTSQLNGAAVAPEKDVSQVLALFRFHDGAGLDPGSE